MRMLDGKIKEHRYPKIDKDKQMNELSNFGQGLIAAKLKKSLLDNPYCPISQEYKNAQWLDGFNAAYNKKYIDKKGRLLKDKNPIPYELGIQNGK